MKGIKHVQFEGYDEGSDGSPYGASIPIEKVIKILFLPIFREIKIIITFYFFREIKISPIRLCLVMLFCPMK